MIPAPGAAVNAARPSRRSTSRPTHNRRPSHPGTIPPTPPRSGKHRRRRLHACHRELIRLLCRPAADLRAASNARLWSWANVLDAGDGRRGRARRLVAKVVRLTMPAA